MERSIPPLTVTQRELLGKGIDLFNREMFFECHEELEQAWLEVASDQKNFLQGLIQVAVAFHHLRRKNLAGARRLLAAGIEKLTLFAPCHEGVQLGGLLESLEPLRQKISAGEVPGDWQSPQILWEPRCKHPTEPSCG